MTTPATPATGTLEVRDTRTGTNYQLPVTDGTIRANDLLQIKAGGDDPGLRSYDPAFLNTASCRSAITYIDGDKGILRYRGYPIEQLAEKSTFLEVAYLLRHGELPTQAQYDELVYHVTYHTYVHENIRKFLEGFRYDAHPMSMLCSSVAALSAFYPDAHQVHDEEQRNISWIRLIAKLPTMAAFAYRHVKGLPIIYPDNALTYTENFLSMIARMSEPRYEPNPVFTKALEVLFILHADHEQNCSTNAVRAVGSSHVDPFTAVAAGIAALFGPLHGGANEAVRQDRLAARRRGFRPGRHGQGSRDRARARAHRARGRVLHQAQAVSQCRLLHRADLSLDGVPDRLLHRALCGGADGGMAGAVGGDAARQGAEDRAAAADLHRLRRAAVRAADLGAVPALWVEGFAASLTEG